VKPECNFRLSQHAPWNKLRGSTNFITFGPMDQKFWRNENLKRSLDRAGKCCSQPARVDHISPKRWAPRIRRFEKSPLRVSSLVFLTFLYIWKGEIFHSSWSLEISFFSKCFAKIRLRHDLHINCWDFYRIQK
jgi:hypothetical protein